MQIHWNGPYDPATQTATWNLSGIAFEDGYYRATLQAGGVSDVAGNWLAGGNYPIDFFRLLGDTDGNARVDIFDVAKVQVNYGQTSGMSPAEGDFDGNGTVDIFDVALLQVAYGKTLDPPATMPAGALGAVEAGSTCSPLVAARPGHSPAQSSQIAESFGGRVSGPPEPEHLTRSVMSTGDRQGWARHPWHTTDSGSTCSPLVAAQPGHSPAQSSQIAESFGGRVSGPPEPEHLTRSVRSTARRSAENVKPPRCSVSGFPRALAVRHAVENVAWASAVDEVLEAREV
ncbi:MAG: hypothetical protein ACYC0Y_07955 [Pirellulales bacterium]